MAFFDGANARAKRRAKPTHMTFRLAGQLYAVKLDIVSEVAPAGDIAPVSDDDPAVIGQTDMHGGAVIVVDMGLRLQGKPVRPRTNGVLLIVRRGEARSGCLLDAPEDMLDIEGDKVSLNGCLVDEAESVTGIPQSGVSMPENASLSGREHGFAMFASDKGIILLPENELFYPM